MCVITLCWNLPNISIFDLCLLMIKYTTVLAQIQIFVVSVRLQNVLECIGNTLCTVDRLHFSLKEIFEDKIYLV